MDEVEALLQGEALQKLRWQRQREATGWVSRPVRAGIRREEREREEAIRREEREGRGGREHGLLEEMAVVVVQCGWRRWRVCSVCGGGSEGQGVV